MSQLEDAYTAGRDTPAQQEEATQQQGGSSLYVEDITCLADTVYFEARSETILGQLAVANVVMNRVFSSNGLDTVCDVVYKGKMSKSGRMIKNKCQFSFYCDGKPERIHDIEGYNQSSVVAALSMSGVYIQGLEEATSFHAVGSKPKWAQKKVFLRRVGNHMFYKDS
jgi:spore germination cell wall hydrolase CwlJ-like protein